MKKALIILLLIFGIGPLKSQIMIDSTENCEITGFAAYDSLNYVYSCVVTSAKPLMLYSCIKATTDAGKTWRVVIADTGTEATDYDKIDFVDIAYLSKDRIISLAKYSFDDSDTTTGYTYLCNLDGSNPEVYQNYRGICRRMRFADSLHGAAAYWAYPYGNAMLTEDGGRTWNVSRISDYSCLDINYIQRFGADTIIYKGMHPWTRRMHFGFTYDGGKTWTRTTQDTLCWSDKPIAFLNAKLGYMAGWRHGIFRDSITDLPVDSTASLMPLIQKTTDGGLTWTTLLTSDNYLFQLWGISAKDEKTLFAISILNNLFRSSDGGMTWDTIILSRKVGFAQKLQPLNPNNTLIVNEHNYIFKWEDRITAAEEPEMSISTAIASPNPCSAGTEIEFAAGEQSRGVLRVVNLSGELVLSKQIDCIAGRNHVPIDVGELPNGMYFCEVRAGNNCFVAKLIVRK